MRFKTIFTWPLIVKIFHTKAKITLCAITGSPILKRDRVFPHHALIAIYIYIYILKHAVHVYMVYLQSWVMSSNTNPELRNGKCPRSSSDLACPIQWSCHLCVWGNMRRIRGSNLWSKFLRVIGVVSTNLAPTWGPPVVCWFITFYEYYSYE